MSLLATTLLSVAASKAVPFVKRILETHLKFGDSPAGKIAGRVAGELVDEIADYAGVRVEELQATAESNPELVAQAMENAEVSAVDLWAKYIDSQRLMNETISLDYQKESWWAWAWRPAWMWLLAILWLYTLIVQPLIRAIWVPQLYPVDASLLMAVTGIFVTFYMGGHTAKEAISRWRTGR